jgi:hypothetical protein
VDGLSYDQGRLEVFYNSVWGTVCDDGIDDNAIEMFCSSMGYDGCGLRTRGKLTLYKHPVNVSVEEIIWATHMEREMA